MYHEATLMLFNQLPQRPVQMWPSGSILVRADPRAHAS